MFEGVLYKKKKGHLADSDSEDDWKSFWCTIEGEMLKVFQLPGKDVAPKPGAKLVQKGFLSLTGCRITRRPNTPNTESNLEFSVLNESNNCVDFKASNEEELERWIGMIENASGIGLEELSEIDFDLGNELKVVEDAIAHPNEAIATSRMAPVAESQDDAPSAVRTPPPFASGRIDIKRMDSASSISSNKSSPGVTSHGSYAGVKTASNPLSRGTSHLGSVSASSADQGQPIQSMYKILVQRSIGKSALQSSPSPAIQAMSPASPQITSALSFEIFGAIIEKAGQGVGFGMLISENSIPGATYITEIRSSAGTKWVSSAVRDSDASRVPSGDGIIRELRPGDQVLRIQDEDIRGYEIKSVAKLLGSFSEGAYVRFVFARGAHVKDNDVFPLPSFPNLSSVLSSSAEAASASRPSTSYYRAKSSNDLSLPSTPPISPIGRLFKSQSQSFSSDATHQQFNVILQKGPAGVGLGISIVEDSSVPGAKGTVIKEVFRTVHINYISERAGGMLRPGDKILSIDRDDFQNAPTADVARRLSMVQEYGTVRLKLQRNNTLSEEAPFVAAPGPLSPLLSTIFESPKSSVTSSNVDIDAANPPAVQATVLSPSTTPKTSLDSLNAPTSTAPFGKPPSHSRSRSDGSSAQSQAASSKRSDELRDSSSTQVSAPITAPPPPHSPVPSPRPQPTEGLTPREMASMVRSPMSPALARTNSSRDFIQYEAIIEKGPPGIGFGILIAEDKAERTVVVKKIKPNLDIRFISPSANGNIQEKDVLVKIDDEEVNHWEIERIVKLLGSVNVGTAVRLRFQRRIYIADPAATAASLDRLRTYSESSGTILSSRQRSDSGSKIAYPPTSVVVTPSRDSVFSPPFAASVDSVVPIALSSVGYPSKDDEELIEMSASASTIDPISPISAAPSSEKMSNHALVPIIPFPEELEEIDSPTARTPDAITDASVGHTEEEVVVEEEEEEKVQEAREDEGVSAAVDAEPEVTVWALSTEEAETEVDIDVEGSLNDTADGDGASRKSLPDAVALRTETFEIGVSGSAKASQATQILDPFSCPVCKSAFAPTGDGCPFVLTCGHSVCAADIKVMCSHDSFTCPVCSSSHRPGDYTGEYPSANHGLIAILIAAPHLVGLRVGPVVNTVDRSAETGTGGAETLVSEIDSSAEAKPSMEATSRIDAAEEAVVAEASEALTAAPAAEISPEEEEERAPIEEESPSDASSAEPPSNTEDLATLCEAPAQTHMCSGCGEAAPAYFCEDCKTDFCETCDADVHKFKLFRSHQRCPIEVKYLMTTTCADHGEVTKFFCEQPCCKKFVCSACCSAGGTHASHDCRPAKDILTEKKRAINSQLQAERDVVRQLDALKSSMQSSLSSTASQADALASQVEQDFSSARAFLDTLEQRIVEGIRSHAAEKSALLSSQLAEVSVCLDSLTASSAQTDGIRGLSVEDLLAHSDDRLEERREASARASVLLGSCSFVDSALHLECGRSCAAAVKTLSYSLLDGASLVSSFAASVSSPPSSSSSSANSGSANTALGSSDISS